MGESRSYNVAGWVGGEWVVGFVSTVFTDKAEEVYLHRGWGGLSGLFTWEVFTTIELFTGRSGVLNFVSRSRFISWRSRAIKVHRLF